MHVGPCETGDTTSQSPWAWIGGQGFAPAGPPAEVYSSNPEERLTEVRIPVSKL